jgi:predicted permease
VSLLRIVGIYLPLALTIVLVVLIVRFKITLPARYAKAVQVAGWTASTVAFVATGILIALHR